MVTLQSACIDGELVEVNFTSVNFYLTIRHWLLFGGLFSAGLMV